MTPFAGSRRRWERARRLVGDLLLPGRALALHASGERRRTNAALGLLGERLAARHLRRGGSRVSARRLATRWGELDLVSRRGGTLVVHEVKTGFAGPLHAPGDRVDDADVRRLAIAASGLAARVGAERWSVELVEVRLSRGGSREAPTVRVVMLATGHAEPAETRAR